MSPEKLFHELLGLELSREVIESRFERDGGRMFLEIHERFKLWKLLRYSGTEPKVRPLVEGRDAAVLKSWSEKICGAIQKQIGN